MHKVLCKSERFQGSLGAVAGIVLASFIVTFNNNLSYDFQYFISSWQRLKRGSL